MNEKDSKEQLNSEIEKDDVLEETSENEDIEDNDKETEKEVEINKEKLDKIKDEIVTSKRKSRNSPKNEKIRKNIFINIWIAIVITIYFLFVRLGVKTIPVTEYLLDLKTFAIFTVIIAIVVLEKAYKKDDDYIALHGIEMIVLGIETLVLLSLYSLENPYFDKTLCIMMLAMIAYYIIKSIIIWIKSKCNRKIKE